MARLGSPYKKQKSVPMARRPFALAALPVVLLALSSCAGADQSQRSGGTGGGRSAPGMAPVSPIAPAAALSPAAEQAAFAQWLVGMRAEALAAGISRATVDSALGRARIEPRIVELDRKQPEFNKTLAGYFASTLPDSRIAKAREMMALHAPLLRSLEQRYGVPGRFLVAFWGLETNFGGTLGSFRVVDALSTLAFEGRRGAFFRAQLLDALRIIDAGHVSADAMIGSWAGAMGQTQFMPSTFRAHAVDYDGDGRIDIWGSLPDALASAAKYLSDLGWKGAEPWGWEVVLPAGLDLARVGLEERRPLADWAALGLRGADGRALGAGARAGVTAALLLPAGYRGPAFLVTDNYFSILKWNRSMLYALAVGLLADRAAGGGPLVHPPPADEAPLRSADVAEIQSRLSALGYDAGTADGVIGAQTRVAIRAYQASIGAPADGYANDALLADLRRRSGR
ncbi:Lytic murein transglycosylase [Rhodospirillum rubrum ATCC 11170]|uniref:Lytic murein transglycosylase n=4 Tax=Rhodospirillum rubrum TaxID=1085 RepID=Q2RTN9_RHORT|nr:Lytic murein transglycosylase [Rhodospirillum rubrum ATCC 11170]